ncbi:MAG: lipid-binding SYLF domain-containing protein [Candidatus Binatia bacterium]|nr:lipid-binding SYLF domain-containing protein [Candidatus Binatia bacterium]
MNTAARKWTSFVVGSGMVLLTVTGAVAKDEIELQTEVDQARTILKGFQSIPEKGIPDAVLRNCKGLAFLTVLRAGFIISGSGGKGVVVAKNDDGTWTGPSFIGTGGAGFGFQIGAQVSEFVMVLNTPEAVQAFAKGGNVSVGAQVSAAAGPVGRSLGAEVMPQAAVYTYSRAQGLFGGVSLDGTVIATRKEANTEYYGKKVSAKAVLVGEVPAPAGADALRADLAKVTAAAKAK